MDNTVFDYPEFSEALAGKSPWITMPGKPPERVTRYVFGPYRIALHELLVRDFFGAPCVRILVRGGCASRVVGKSVDIMPQVPDEARVLMYRGLIVEALISLGKIGPPCVE